jgi:hypothetical protein
MNHRYTVETITTATNDGKANETVIELYCPSTPSRRNILAKPLLQVESNEEQVPPSKVCSYKIIHTPDFVLRYIKI